MCHCIVFRINPCVSKYHAFRLNCVTSVRQEVTGKRQSTQFDSPGTRDNGSGAPPAQLPQQHDQLSPAQEARQIADKHILDAECFKASVAAPTGNIQNFTVQNNGLQSGDFPRTDCNPLMDNDDDFFHLTCHIEPGLRSKIEKGEFVELEKLLPKKKFPHKLGYDNRLEMINKEGYTYFVPATDKENTINGIKKWDQAFRVYVAIYCKENPSRSAEVWQYIFTIHTAASSFQWDNIAWYNYTFRQLMAAKPYHSWAKTYTQFWNLAMRNPLNSTSMNGSYGHGGQGSSSKGGNCNKKFGDWHDNCC